MTKRFPKTVFVKWEQSTNDEPYLVTSEEMDGLVEFGTKTKIATYQLVETTEAELIVNAYKPVKAKR